MENLNNPPRKLVANYAIFVKAPDNFPTFAVVYDTIALFSSIRRYIRDHLYLLNGVEMIQQGRLYRNETN